MDDDNQNNLIGSEEGQTKKPEEENSDIPVPDTGLVADPDVLTPDEAEDDIDIEIVLENLAPEDVAEEMAEYTDDEDIMEDFADRQQFNTGGRKMLDNLESYNQASPDLSAGDIDAEWERANTSGEEAFTGDSPTPDQDIVDNEGLAAGLTYGLEEELNSDKVNDRDRNRWELNPESADDENTAEDVRDLNIDVEKNQGEDET